MQPTVHVCGTVNNLCTFERLCALRVKNRIGFAVSTVCGTDSELGAWTAIYGERCINRNRYSADVYAGKGEKLSRFKIFAGLSATPYPRPADGHDANNVTIIHLGRPTPNPYGIIPSRFVFFVPYVGLSRSINNIEFGHDKNDLKSHYCFFSSFFSILFMSHRHGREKKLTKRFRTVQRIYVT